MEVIKKKIHLEQFKSRIPGLVKCVGDTDSISLDGSWGKIPIQTFRYEKNDKYFGIRYGTAMHYYYAILKTIIGAEYYEYITKDNKWYHIDYDWRNFLVQDSNKSNTKQCDLLTEFPDSDSTVNKTIVGIISSESYDLLYNKIPYGILYTLEGDEDEDKEDENSEKDENSEEENENSEDEEKEEVISLFDNGIAFIKDINTKIGRIVVPPVVVENNEKKVIEGTFVPEMIFQTQVSELITRLEELKDKSQNSCCDIETYEDYGGDTFYNFLKSQKNNEVKYGNSGNTVTIDIPILLTTNIKDLGQFKLSENSYEEGDEGSTSAGSQIGEWDYISYESNVLGSTIVTGGTGESKLLTLRKRRRSYDDDGKELPVIFDIETEEFVLPFEIGYLKNIQLFNGQYYGDTIQNIIINEDDMVITFTYVIGGRLETFGDNLVLDEISPYTVNDKELWDGDGIWYQETYPYIIESGFTFTLNGKEYTKDYMKIDFESSMVDDLNKTIDFPNKKYILSTDISYRREIYEEGDKPLYRDEKMVGMNENMRESYDVAIDRGYSSAFERHFLLGEIKTFQDLEMLRNNMFNI